LKRLKRGTYIGGQQITAVTGMHPYSSIGDVYAKSVLGVQGITDAEIDADPSSPSVLRRGKICEAGLVDYVERACLKLPPGTLKRDLFVIDPDVPFFAGTIDAAEVDDQGRITHIHEVTVTSSRAVDAHWGVDGDPGGAAKYKWIQDQWYQGLSGAGGGTIWLMVSDTGEIRRYPVKRSDVAIEQLRNDGEQFWMENVLPKKPPAVDCQGIGAWAVAEKSLDAMYNTDGGGELEATAALVAAANDYDAARDAVKKAEEWKRGSAAKLKASLQDSTWSKWDGGRVSWKRNKDRKVLDHESAFNKLAAESGMTEENIEERLKLHTNSRRGPRILRVTISAEKDEEPGK